jgi:hypothetical protein
MADWDDDDEPIAPAVPAPAFSGPTTLDDDDEPLTTGPARTLSVPFPPAAPRTVPVSNVIYDDDDDDIPREALPRESPKRLCSSGEPLAREHTTFSSFDSTPADATTTAKQQQPETTVAIGQWRDEATGMVVEPLPLPPATFASMSAFSSTDELVECPCPLAPYTHSSACPCVRCIDKRAYERGKAEGTVRERLVGIRLLADSDHAYDPYAVAPEPGQVHPAHVPEAVFQIPVPAPSPPAVAARRRKQTLQPSQSDHNDARSADASQSSAPEPSAPTVIPATAAQTKPGAKPKAARRPRARGGEGAADRERRGERDDMAASRDAYEASVPTTVREATTFTAIHEMTEPWLAMIGVFPPKEESKDKKMRLAFRASMRAPYDTAPIRTGIRELLDAMPPNKVRVTKTKPVRPQFIVDAMFHDMVASSACGMIGFDKSMKTRPCAERPSKPGDKKRKMCNAHSLTLKAVRILVVATVGTARLLDLTEADALTRLVLDTLAELVHWFAAASVYSNRAFSGVELYACTRFLVSTLIDGNSAKARTVLDAHAPQGAKDHE